MQFQPPSRASKKTPTKPAIQLTGTQVRVHNALVAALLGPSALIVLTGAAALGKTSVLSAALASIAGPSLEIVQFDGVGSGMDQSFEALFAAARLETLQPGLPERRPERRIVLVVDQAETLPPGGFTYLELLTRMPGKDASVQLIIVGRPEIEYGIEGSATDLFQDAAPVHLVLPPLTEQDAWDLFRRRVGSIYAQQSIRRVVMMLLERCGGMPGRFDEALRAAVAGGLLEGVPG